MDYYRAGIALRLHQSIVICLLESGWDMAVLEQVYSTDLYKYESKIMKIKSEI